VFWVVVLVPPLLRARAEHVSRDSIRDFSFKIGALGHANAPYRPAPFRSTRNRPAAPLPVNVRPVGLPPMAYGPSSAAAERSALRRRQVFSVLGISAVVTLMLAISGTPGAWVMFAVASGLLVAYVLLVGYFRPSSSARIPLERLAQVRHLPPVREQTPAPQFAYRRTVNS
jgi:hypothetical protein